MLQAQKEKAQYSEIVQQVIPKLETIGFEGFKADIPDYDPPKRFSLQGDPPIQFSPDISAERRGRQAFIEISSKDSNESHLVSKWKLLSQLMTAKDGFFGIVMPKGTIKFTRELVEKHKIEANLIRI